MAEYGWDANIALSETQLNELGITLTQEMLDNATNGFEQQVAPDEEFPKIERFEEYKKFLTKLGSRCNIVKGGFVDAPDGEFLITDKLVGTNIIYVNRSIADFSIMSDNKFIGLDYILTTQNCAILTAKYLDYAKQDGVNYEKMMKSIPLRKLIFYFRNAVAPLLEELGFTSVPVEQIQVNDIIVWQYNTTATSHMGVYLGDNKLLHHIPQRISCIDNIDLSSNKVLGVYRYG
jgi:hypothetical protein